MHLKIILLLPYTRSQHDLFTFLSRCQARADWLWSVLRLRPKVQARLEPKVGIYIIMYQVRARVEGRWQARTEGICQARAEGICQAIAEGICQARAEVGAGLGLKVGAWLGLNVGARLGVKGDVRLELKVDVRLPTRAQNEATEYPVY